MDNFTIPMTFVVLFALVSWFIISARGKWFIKAFMMAGAIYSSILVWNALESYQGWPSTSELPQKFLLHWVIVEEPNKKTGEHGSFYLWTVELRKKEDSKGNPLEYQPVQYEPRAYVLDYDPNNPNHKEMHKALQGFKNDIIKSKGKPVALEVKKKGEGEKGDGKVGKDSSKDKDGKKDGKGDGGVRDFSTPDYQFHKLTPGRNIIKTPAQ